MMTSNLWIPRVLVATRALTRNASRQRPPCAAATVAVRLYRGQAGEAPPLLSEKEQALVDVAQPKSEQILAKHHRLPNVEDIPPASLDPTTITTSNHQDVSTSNLDIRRKRLIYRSKQRGWLEVDLLLGTWAHENVPLLTEAELDEYEAFVNLETIDILQKLTMEPISLDDTKTPTTIVERIQAWTRASPLGQADPEKYKQVKTANKLI